MVYSFLIQARKVLLVILFICFHNFSFAQKAENTDTSYILKLFPIAETILNTGKTDSARQLFQKIIAYSLKAKFGHGIIKGYSGLGLSESNAGNMEEALVYYQTAIKTCDTITGKERFLPSIYNNIAIVYHYQGDYNKAIQHYLKAIHIREKNPEASIALEKLYNNIAALLNDISQFEKTIYYLKKSEQLAKSHKNYSMLASNMQNQGTAYAEMGYNEKSRAYFLKSLKIAQEHNLPDLIHKSYVNLANLSLKQEEPQKAIGYLKEAMSIKENILPYQRSIEAVTLGNAYLKTNNKKLAAYYLKRALSISQQYNMPRDILDAHKSLSNLYVSLENYQLAYQHQNQAWTLSDSINNNEKTKAIMRMETSYRSVLKDKEIAEKELLINRQQSSIYKRNVWIIIVLTCLLAAGIFIVLLRKSYLHKQALKDERVQRLIKQQEVKEMKAIINAEEKERNRIAHDLHDGIMIQFSIVKMNMSALLGENEQAIPKEKITPIIRQLDTATQSLRKAAHYLMPDMLLDNGLAEAIHYLCNSLKEDISFHIRIEQLDTIPRFGIQFELIIYRIMQELLQNVIKHAKATEVYIQLSYSNSQLGIDVEDNGIGLPAIPIESMGLGLKSIKARVQSLNGHMHIKSTGNGTYIGLEFNLDHLKNDLALNEIALTKKYIHNKIIQ